MSIQYLYYHVCTFLDEPLVTATVSPATTLEEGKTLYLSCQNESNPQADSILWTKDDRLISHSPDLLINVTRNDSGLYRCIVNNTKGCGMDQFHIGILCMDNIDFT